MADDSDLLRILICFQTLFLQICFAYQMINIRFQRFTEDWYRQRWERRRRQMRQAGAFMLMLAERRRRRRRAVLMQMLVRHRLRQRFRPARRYFLDNSACACVSTTCMEVSPPHHWPQSQTTRPQNFKTTRPHF